MVLRRRALLLVVLVMTAIPLVLAGCTGNPLRRAERPAPPPPKLAITPASDSRDLPTSVEIGTAVTDGKVTEVVVTDAGGTRVDGAMRADGTSWMPSRALANKQTYTARVTAKNDAGKAITQETTFSTMDKPAKRTVTNLNLQSDQTYGVAMPITVSFDSDIPKDARAGIQRRLLVTTDPPQPGAWSWDENGRQVSYRAPDFWRPGTTIGVRAALDGVPMGEGSFGDTDRAGTAKIGNRVFLEIDNATKQMSVFKDDVLVKKIPVSLGKSSTPTSSGKMVIMEKHESTVFDTTGSPDPYVVTVFNAQRLTWGGEFIHAAPWSVGAQGERNVSHGCTNVSDENSEWLMETTRIGDLVTIRGTEVTLDQGNGWTAWNVSWDEFTKGSALPVPADIKPAPPAPPAGPASGGPPAADKPAAPSPSGAGR
ncbi:Ig-like domain-containing protein [Plantactinospora sp. WMMC1484]|uniref:L,D-transpeptidase n=1 Tax=Plantactinospora sp. WMMC1484 TaxID=3404122 RepID=UPI003BF525AF